ncbi:hypothetical protein SpCBS45565_g01512 [Spizellomyces sp. 'palustris']|nr:hypothetical protein SpCBS45565_g01512 [Spizellomyces sp. 'palustris']
MEVEIKIRLPSRETYEQVVALFKIQGIHCRTERQENWFLDGCGAELQNDQSIFRIRRADINDHSVLNEGSNDSTQQPLVAFTATIKGNALLTDGVSRVAEEERPISTELAERLLRSPSDLALISQDHPLLGKLAAKLNHPSDTRIIGSYSTLREVFEWKRWKVEVDATVVEKNVRLAWPLPMINYG